MTIVDVDKFIDNFHKDHIYMKVWDKNGVLIDKYAVFMPALDNADFLECLANVGKSILNDLDTGTRRPEIDTKD